MPQITGKENIFHTLKMVYKNPPKNLDEGLTENAKKLKMSQIEIDHLIKILEANKIKSLYNVGQGFVAYQFDYGKQPSPHVKLADSLIEDIYVIKHFEKKQVKGKTIPENIENLLGGKTLTQSEKNVLHKILDQMVFHTYYQDFIFIPNNSITLILPSNNIDDTLKFKLTPYIEEFLR